MILNKIDDLKFLTFENLNNTNLVNHCFSTKFGGVSTGVYSSMNLSFRNDNKENVIKNFEIICSAINCDYKNVVFASQVHKDNVAVIDKKHLGMGLLKPSTILEADALITNEPEIVLTTFFADCVPIFIVDPIKKAIGAVHSGWKGTVLEISKKTILKMQQVYNTNPKDLIVGIAPSIHSCCFDVHYDTVKIFEEKLPFSQEFIYNNLPKNKFKIDLQNIIKQSILSTGVLLNNIEISNLCTKCNSDMFFSHRVMGNDRGSLAGLISLKK